ncbi:MAG: DUF423 domain-containing protein [Bdellovibrionota bacterium]
MNWTNWISLGSFFAFVSVALGAFGAHAMKGKYSDYHLSILETAVKYQMYHALALLAVAFVASRIDSTAIKTAGFSFSLGIILFSGSLYGIIFFDNKAFGWITPIGGLAFIVGWIALLISTRAC